MSRWPRAIGLTPLGNHNSLPPYYLKRGAKGQGYSKEGDTPPKSPLHRGEISSLWEREVERDFIMNVFILMTS